jgi:hypothetical protein
LVVALALPLAPACARRDAADAPAPAADSLALARAAAERAVAALAFAPESVAAGRRRVALDLGRGDSLALLHVRPGAMGDWEARVVRADGSTEPLERVPGGVTLAGIADLHADGTRDAVWVLESGGSGMTVKELHLYCPRARRAFELTLTFAHDLAQPVPGELRGDGLELPGHALEAALLDRAKRLVGYVDDADLAARPDDARHAFYFWARDNVGLAEGAAMRSRRFAGRPRMTGSAEDTLDVGGIEYVAWFKAGVTAYDPRAEQHWVVFHPGDPYQWPTRLAFAGGVLVIGTRGQGLALVRLSDLALRRLSVPGYDTIDALAVTDSTITVNGASTVAMPGF